MIIIIIITRNRMLPHSGMVAPTAPRHRACRPPRHRRNRRLPRNQRCRRRRATHIAGVLRHYTTSSSCASICWKPKVSEECVECALPPRNPSADLRQMNIRSAPSPKESTCQISSPSAKAFDTISSLQNSDLKKEYEKTEQNWK